MRCVTQVKKPRFFCHDPFGEIESFFILPEVFKHILFRNHCTTVALNISIFVETVELIFYLFELNV